MSMKKKILIADVLLADKPHSDWKEGYEFCYAFRNLGHVADVFGPNGSRSEKEIPDVAEDYDLVLITENYPGYSGWKWWDWRSIKTPKLFWAIDTHLLDFSNWINFSKIDFVAFNNPVDIDRYKSKNSFWMPYGGSKTHYSNRYSNEKKRDCVFIGGMLPERKRICDKFGIECLTAYGEDYVREMQQSKICFNQSMSYDINSKYFEILSSGSFMLTNYNKDFHEFMDLNEDIEKMFYYDEDDLGRKIEYYLKNESEREEIARRAHKYTIENHSYENRAQLILEKVFGNNI